MFGVGGAQLVLWQDADRGVRCGRREWGEGSGGEFGADLDGGGVGPVGVDGGVEDVAAGVVGVDGDVDVVALGAAGHADVQGSAVDGPVDDEQAVVDGGALGAVHGLGVAKLNRR